MDPVLVPALVLLGSGAVALGWVVTRVVRGGRAQGVHELLPFDGPSGRKGTVHFGKVKIDGAEIEYTEFAAKFTFEQGAMRISTSDWCGPLETTFGARDVRIGQPESDARYVIQGNPESLPKRALDAATLDRLWHVHSMGRAPFLLQLRQSHLVIRVSRKMERGAHMHNFVQECFALVDRFANLADPQLQLQKLEERPEAECQVCGTGIEDAHRVFCRKCRTPHHQECWEYNDGCSTFACGERRCART